MNFIFVFLILSFVKPNFFVYFFSFEFIEIDKNSQNKEYTQNKRRTAIKSNIQKMSKSNASYFILPTSDLERSSLQTSQTKTTKKSNYGSLRQESLTQQTANKFIVNYEHKLLPGDTLLGISLKYNISVCFNF